MEYLYDSAPTIYRRRRRRRALITLSFVSSMLVATVLYAASIQGWIGSTTPKPATGAACFETISNGPLRPSSVTLNVYNTTARTGLAASVARRLQGEGYRIATIDNDPMGKSIQGVGEIRHGPMGIAAATLAANRLRGSTVVLDDRTDASVDFVLGNKFTALSAPAKNAPQIAVKRETPCKALS